MNQDLASIKQFFETLKLDDVSCETWIAPQALHIQNLVSLAPNNLHIGGQNIAETAAGAFTGENSGKSLKELGASFFLVGHSERRSLFNEDDDLLNKKVHFALDCGLKVIFCVGETLEERTQGVTESVIKSQLIEGLEGLGPQQIKGENLLIAYEPVWAIGTGEVATPEQAQAVHKFIKNTLVFDLDWRDTRVPLLYGGSVKPSNAEGLLSQKDIDGALVGGASLKSGDFAELASIASGLMNS
jgi:triosephosphate isomerase